ncbi:MAG: flagellar biosynthesis anti-sigma factor FlgM [Phycisphaerales bacterium]|nr:flagellar biosynthesis anti-sigma factor FlgM [Phycisphaerales bacterium]
MSEFTQVTHSPLTIASCSTARQNACDRADLSDEHAQHVAQTRTLPDVRAERISKIKGMIADGTFDTDARLSAAIDRMLTELRHH